MEVNARSAKKLQRKRRFKYGVNATLFTIGVVGILVLIFVMIHRAGWRFDFTANRDFSLSEQTEHVLSSLEQPVQISAFFRRQGDIDQVYIRRKIDDILREYAQKSPQVDYGIFDPDLDVEATLQYGIHADGTIVFQSGDRRKDIFQSQLFNYPSLDDGSLPLFVGESLFTNAILALTKEPARTVCFLSGHRERSIEDREAEGLSTIKAALVSENYQVKAVNFSENPDWNEICDLLIVAGAKLGLHRREDQAIWDFIEKGKKVFVMVDPRSEVGLTASLGTLKVRFHEAVAFDPERHFLLGSHYPAPVLLEHPITEKLREQELTPIFYLARPLELPDSEGEDSYQAEALLATSDQAWGETQLKAGKAPKRDPGQDLEGPLTIGAVITRKVEKKPVAVVFGDSNFITNGLIEIPGNRDLFLNSVAWLVGSEEQIAIRPQKTDFRPLILDPDQVRLMSALTQFVYPFLFLAAGLTYWWRRTRGTSFGRRRRS